MCNRRSQICKRRGRSADGIPQSQVNPGEGNFGPSVCLAYHRLPFDCRSRFSMLLGMRFPHADDLGSPSPPLPGSSSLVGRGGMLPGNSCHKVAPAGMTHLSLARTHLAFALQISQYWMQISSTGFGVSVVPSLVFRRHEQKSIECVDCVNVCMLVWGTSDGEVAVTSDRPCSHPGSPPRSTDA